MRSAGAELGPVQLDADGVAVSVVAGTSRADVSDIFAQHLRLLGPDPAHWTTRPIG